MISFIRNISPRHTNQFYSHREAYALATFEGNTVKMFGKLWKIRPHINETVVVFSVFLLIIIERKFVADRHSSDFQAMCLISYMCQNNHYHQKLTETNENYSLAHTIKSLSIRIPFISGFMIIILFAKLIHIVFQV